MKILIIGAGPRALSVAIYALHKGIEPILIDPNPLGSWLSTPSLPDTLMRSPTSFDLVSFLDRQDFSYWRLDTFLNCVVNYNTQEDIEANTDLVLRTDFTKYLEFCLEAILLRGGSLVKSRVASFSNKHVRLDTEEVITGDAVVFAIGACTANKVPVWVNSNKLYDKLVPLPKTKSITNSSVAVIGSGQSAAEYALYLLSNGCSITWITEDKYKTTRYPVPTYMDWGPRSALGPYYRSLRGDTSLSESYLASVKQWQPSLTPEVVLALEPYASSIHKVDPLNNEEIADSLSSADYIVACTGPNPSIDNIPNNELIHRLPSNTNFPLLINGMRTLSGLYFTGLLAMRFDGTRQGSVVSAGLSAKEIVEDITSDN